MRFLKLLDPYDTQNDPTALERRQLEAIRQFPHVVANSPVKYWRPGDFITAADRRLLIGLGAGFHRPNLRLLDLISDSLRSGHKSTSVDVFNIEDIKELCQFSNYFPGLVLNTFNLSQLPIIGIWEDGKHVRNLLGYDANKYLLDLFNTGITPSELYDSVRPPPRELMDD